MILATLVLAATGLTATARPAAPAVGDLITVEFQQPVVLDASEDYEIVEQRGNRAVVRTFEARPFALSGTAGNIRFRNLVVPVKSVLRPNDDLSPAGLVPPKPSTMPRRPWIAIAIAALVALLAWAFAWWRNRAVVVPFVPAVAADVRFRQTVLALRNDSRAPLRWAALADATRAYLAATRPDLGLDLTTTELLRRHHDSIVETILRQGDLEKFSPWGPRVLDFNDVAASALTLAPEKVEVAA